MFVQEKREKKRNQRDYKFQTSWCSHGAPLFTEYFSYEIPTLSLLILTVGWSMSCEHNYNGLHCLFADTSYMHKFLWHSDIRMNVTNVIAIVGWTGTHWRTWAKCEYSLLKCLATWCLVIQTITNCDSESESHDSVRGHVTTLHLKSCLSMCMYTPQTLTLTLSPPPTRVPLVTRERGETLDQRETGVKKEWG